MRSPISGQDLLRAQLAYWARFWSLPTRELPGDEALFPILNLSHWLETPSLQWVGRSGYLGSQENLLHDPHHRLCKGSSKGDRVRQRQALWKPTLYAPLRTFPKPVQIAPRPQLLSEASPVSGHSLL